MSLWLGAVGAALTFGLAAAVLPAWLLVAVLVVPIFTAVLLLRPEIGLAAFMGLACGLVHPALLPRFTMFGGTVGAADLGLLLLGAYAVAILGWRGRRAPASGDSGVGANERWIWWPLAVFSMLAALAVVDALLFKGLRATLVLGEARDLAYLLVAPVAALVLRDEARLRRFVAGLVVLGLLFSAGQILQGLFDVRVFGGSSRLEVLETLGHRQYGATRSITPGINLVILALLLVVGAYVSGALRAWRFVGAAAVLSSGILLTFGRTTYAVVLFCIVLLVTWLNPRRLPRLLGLVLLAGSLGVAALAMFKPAALSGLAYRIANTGTELVAGASAQWRYEENRHMLPRIAASPLTGIGLGAEYKGLAGSSLTPELNRYIHNGYLYMAGKMGLPALAALLVFMAAVARAGRAVTRAPDRPRLARVVAACSAVMMWRFALASMTEPHLMADNSLVVIALCAGLAVLCLPAGRGPAG